MLLTSDQMHKLAREVVLGKESSIKTEEAKEFVNVVKKDIDQAKKRGWEIDIPFEWQE